MNKIFELSLEIEALIIAVLVSLSCSIVGSFIVTKRMSMISDGISHAILLGIVLAFFVVKNLNSPFLLLGAVISGICLVIITELLKQSQLVTHDTALGLIFPFFFSLGVLLIAKYANKIHLDLDAVILGELAFAPFNRLEFAGYDLGSKALVFMIFILLLNLIMLLFFYKEFFLICFDEELAKLLNFKPKLLNYSLVFVLSVTTVGAFEAVGSILVVALLVVPPATSIMLTQQLKQIIALAAAISVLTSITGFYLAVYFDLIISGMISTLLGIIFLFVLLFNSKNGYFFRLLSKRKKTIDNHIAMLLVHLSQHSGTQEEAQECNQNNIAKHLFWKSKYTKKLIKIALQKKLIYLKEDILKLSINGKQQAKEITEF